MTSRILVAQDGMGEMRNEKLWQDRKILGVTYRRRKWSVESHHHFWRVTKKKVKSGILSSFLAGDQKRKLGQEFYHHSWRVTHKQFEVRNPIIIISKNKKVLACKIAQKESEVRNSFIILGGWSKKKVRSGILSSFLTVDPKSKWHLES